MSVPVLATKLNIPPPRRNILPRPRLDDALSAGLEGALTLVSAPAGYGKSTLVSNWLRASEGHCAWLSLDEGDNDPVRFLTYLLAAFQRVDPSLGKELSGFLQMMPLPPTDVLLGELIGGLAGLSYDVILVLDDFHAVYTEAIQDAVSFLLERRPDNFHIILISRTDPLFPLSRLRSQGQLVEIRSRDLCFNRDEITQLLNQISDLNLTRGQIDDLETRTEGWIAGLQLLVHSMQGRPDVNNFIADFTGSHRYITDYLMEEVLRRQTEPVRNFLLQTSLLDRMCSPLCEAVLGGGEVNVQAGQADFPPTIGDAPAALHAYQSILEYLEHANLFVVPLDDRRQWYRYHHLFSDVLRNRLVDTAPQRIVPIHQKAAQWFQANGFPEEALKHRIASGDLDGAARFIAQNASLMLSSGEIATLLSWVEKLPPELIHAHPWLCVHYATALMLIGQIPAVEPLFRTAEANIEKIDPSERRALLGDMAAMRSHIASRSGDVPLTIRLAQQALEDLPAEDLTVRSVVAYTLGNAHLLDRNAAGAAEAFSDAVRMGKAAGNIYIAVAAISSLSNLHFAQGRLHAASDLYQQSEILASQHGHLKSRMLDYGTVWQANLLREQNNLQAVLQILLEHIRLCELWRSTDAIVISSTVLARTHQALGNSQAAFEVIRQAQELVDHYLIDTSTLYNFLACQAWLWIVNGNLAEAERGLAGWPVPPGGVPGLLDDLHRTTLARLMLAQGRAPQALALLQALEDITRSAGFNGQLIGLLVLKALALRDGQDFPSAHAALEEALELAAPEGYVRIFLDEGRPMRELLLQVSRKTKSPAVRSYVDMLLKEAVPHHPVPADLPPQWEQSLLVEPLTEREIEVLTLLASGLSNQEIAQKLVIEVSTVKRHISNIFDKLGVQSRTQAVSRGREVGLL